MPFTDVPRVLETGLEDCVKDEGGRLDGWEDASDCNCDGLRSKFDGRTPLLVEDSAAGEIFLEPDLRCRFTFCGEAARDEDEALEVGVTAVERIEVERERVVAAGTPSPLDFRLCVCTCVFPAVRFITVKKLSTTHLNHFDLTYSNKNAIIRLALEVFDTLNCPVVLAVLLE